MCFIGIKFIYPVVAVRFFRDLSCILCKKKCFARCGFLFVMFLK